MILLKPVFIIAIVAVAMIGVMVPSGFGQETPSSIKEESPKQKIPTWIKNVAILWIDDEITNDEFLNTIKYLKESNIIKITKITDYDFVGNETNSDKFHEIIQWYSSASDALQNPVKSNFVLPTIEGQLDSFTSKIPVELTIIDPNGESRTIADITRNGKYSVTPKDPEQIISGIYVIEIRVAGELTNTQYSFLDGDIENIQNVSIDNFKKEIPAWIKSTATLWINDEITNDDFLQGIKFLVKRDIIPLKQNALNNLAAEIWFEKIKQNNSKLNTDSTSDIMDISKYEDNQECRTELKKINKLTIQSMKQCDKINSNSHVKTPKMYDTIDRIVESREHKNGNKGWIEPIPQTKNVYTSGNYNSQDSQKSNSGLTTGSYGGYDYNYGYSGGYDYNYNDADIQRYLSQADSFAQQYLNALEPYAQQYLNDIEPYAQQYVNGDISYGQYEQFAMKEYGGYENAALDLYSYYENQFMNDFYDYP